MPDDADDLTVFLAALFGEAPSESFVELRLRTSKGMRQLFHSSTDLDDVAADVVAHRSTTDVYIGVIPRRCHSGRRAHLVPQGDALWVDCDTTESVVALRRFRPAPSIVVESGTGRNCHAYWLLEHSATLDDIEDANRSLATALSGDIASADAARILRPPLSLNHKHDPSASVTLRTCDGARSRIEHIVGDLPMTYPRRTTSTSEHGVRRVSADPLLSIAPHVYIERLTGEVVPHSRKITCPFHHDRTPSLHAYREPHEGWTCFGCGRGGSIYDFASMTLGIPARGQGFHVLHDLLQQIFAPSIQPRG